MAPSTTGSRFSAEAPTTASVSKPSELPAWAQDAMKEETLAQPWRERFGTEQDDPNFAQGQDTVVFYDQRIKVCYGETSLAA